MNRGTAARGIAWNMGFAVIGKLAFPIVGIFIARSIGPAALGVFAVINTIFAVIELLREAGLGASYLADPEMGADRERLYAGVALGTSLLMGFALLAASHAVGNFFGAPPWTLWTAALCSMVSGWIVVPANRLQREARFRDLGFIDFLASLMSYSVALALAVAGFGLTSLVIQLVVRVSLYSVGVLVVSKFVTPAFRRDGWPILRGSLANLTSNLAYFVYTTFDYLLVKKLLGSNANGAYFTAFNLASKPLDLISVPVIRTVFIAYGRAAGNRERQTDLWIRATGFLALLTLPVYGLLGFHADTIIRLLYSSTFAAAGPALQLLSIYLGVRAFGAAAGSALLGTGHAKLNALAWIPGYLVAAVGIALVWADPTLDKIVGSLTAGIVATYATQLSFAFWKLPPTPAQRRTFVKRVLAGLATALTFGFSRLLTMHASLQLCLAGAVGVVLHMGVCGQVLAGDWKKAFSKRGWRSIYDNL